MLLRGGVALTFGIVCVQKQMHWNETNALQCNLQSGCNTCVTAQFWIQCTLMFVLHCIVEQCTIQEHFELVAMGNTKAAYKWDEIRLVMNAIWIMLHV